MTPRNGSSRTNGTVRALVYIQPEIARLVSRRRHAYTRFTDLCHELHACLQHREAVLDGEIVILDLEGRPTFIDLLRRRGQPRFYAFDIVMIDGRDLRALPLIERKQILGGLISPNSQTLLYSAHIEEAGTALFNEVCRRDLEGIVAKARHGRYVCGPATSPLWAKVKNPAYSQPHWSPRTLPQAQARPHPILIALQSLLSDIEKVNSLDRYASSPPALSMPRRGGVLLTPAPFTGSFLHHPARHPPDTRDTQSPRPRPLNPSPVARLVTVLPFRLVKSSGFFDSRRRVHLPHRSRRLT
ncbi:MAG TPA: hypothetical protein VFE22_02875 [Edaphobacter sp.]|nr:hypothetical protein [Edaphobacter sp.]